MIGNNNNNQKYQQKLKNSLVHYNKIFRLVHHQNKQRLELILTNKPI